MDKVSFGQRTTKCHLVFQNARELDTDCDKGLRNGSAHTAANTPANPKNGAYVGQYVAGSILFACDEVEVWPHNPTETLVMSRRSFPYPEMS